MICRRACPGRSSSSTAIFISSLWLTCWARFRQLGVVLVDRHRARIFDLRLGELTEREGLFQPLSRKARSDGYAGYDGGHAQRRVDDEVRHHFKAVAETF